MIKPAEVAEGTEDKDSDVPICRVPVGRRRTECTSELHRVRQSDADGPFLLAFSRS